MRILLTRPREDGEAMAAILRAMGHTVIVAPLLDIRFDECALDVEADIQAIAMTSANGVRAFARANARRDLPVFAVGPQTAAEARDAGFLDVRDAGGDVAALAEACARWTAPECGAVLHVVGSNATGRLAVLLRARGFDVRTVALYDVIENPSLPEDARDALRDGIDAVLCFSPRSAAALRDGVIAAGLRAACAHVTACCISRAAADALDPLVFAQVRVASRPDQDAMLDLLRGP